MLGKGLKYEYLTHPIPYAFVIFYVLKDCLFCVLVTCCEYTGKVLTVVQYYYYPQAYRKYLINVTTCHNR